VPITLRLTTTRSRNPGPATITKLTRYPLCKSNRLRKTKTRKTSNLLRLFSLLKINYCKENLVNTTKFGVTKNYTRHKYKRF
jgi:hypothetical protein